MIAPPAWASVGVACPPWSCSGVASCCCRAPSPPTRLPACACLVGMGPLLLLVVSTINSHLILLWWGQGRERRRRGFSGKKGSMGGPESSWPVLRTWELGRQEVGLARRPARRVPRTLFWMVGTQVCSGVPGSNPWQRQPELSTTLRSPCGL